MARGRAGVGLSRHLDQAIITSSQQPGDVLEPGDHLGRQKDPGDQDQTHMGE